nr:polysaccharide deacetylase family protein [Streptomyces tsukubensis]
MNAPRSTPRRVLFRAPRRTLRRTRAVLAVSLAAGVAAGCAASGGGPGGHSGAQGAAGARVEAPAARALDAYATRLGEAHTAWTAAVRRWGLAKRPLTAPPPPAVKPHIGARPGFEVRGQKHLPPVFTTVPTTDRVVFLTIDDGAEKDPEFLRMMTELRIPYTAFLSDFLVKKDYGYFERMRDKGVTLNNHTLNHRFLPALSYESQRREICGMQDVIRDQYGKRPRLFRPPYGDYNRDTLRAAKSCGVKAVPLWNAEAFTDRLDYREWDRDLHPGDIVLTHFQGRGQWKGTMPDMVRTFMKVVTDKGFAVARLEDYL